MIGLFEDPFWEEYLRRRNPQAFEANDRLYETRQEQLEALRETQKEWVDHKDPAQTKPLKTKLEDLAKALNIAETEVFTDEELTTWFYNRLVREMGDARNGLARDLTRTALTNAGL